MKYLIAKLNNRGYLLRKDEMRLGNELIELIRSRAPMRHRVHIGIGAPRQGVIIGKIPSVHHPLAHASAHFIARFNVAVVVDAVFAIMRGRADEVGVSQRCGTRVAVFEVELHNFFMMA